MKAFFVALLALVLVAADGAMNLKIFNDPKDVLRKKRRPCSTTASACEPPDLDLMADQEFLQSQNGEDRCLLQQYFPGVCEGRYLDVGALDGIHHSNTYALYKVMGWKGVTVEVDPDNYERLAINRKNDIANVHAAVCSESQQVHYAISKDDRGAGGIWEFASEAHRKEHWKGMTEYNAIPLKCASLQSILDRTVGTKPYYFDLATFDVEGAELSALLGIDFERISFGVIIVEKNEDADANRQVEDLLRAQGYVESYVEEECGTSNLRFVHQQFRGIYQKIKASR